MRVEFCFQAAFDHRLGQFFEQAPVAQDMPFASRTRFRNSSISSRLQSCVLPLPFSLGGRHAEGVPQPALNILGMLPIMVQIEDAAKRSAKCPPIGLQEPGFWERC